MTEKQDHIILKLNEIAEITSEIMNEAVTGEELEIEEFFPQE